MPYVERTNARLFYEARGEGEVLIANHGFVENTGYWRESGLMAALATDYRFVAYDLRGHGRTEVIGDTRGYDVATMSDDIDALADHLGAERFHLLSHATGGMVAVRYALRDSRRLASLVLTDTCSATAFGHEHSPGDWDEVRRRRRERASRAPREPWPFSFEEISRQIREGAPPFFHAIPSHRDRDRIVAELEAMFRASRWAEAQAFFRSFYLDPDPLISAMRALRCPTLVLLGAEDTLMLPGSRLMAESIPDCRYVELAGVGHMTAMEAPAETLASIREFLRTSGDRHDR